MFLDIQEPDAEELGAITIAFENRLKGKPDNHAPQQIDQKYLWKNRDHGSNKESVSPIKEKSAEAWASVGKSADKLPQEALPATSEDSQKTVAKHSEGQSTDEPRKKSSHSKRRRSRKSTAPRDQSTGGNVSDSDQAKNPSKKIVETVAGKEAKTDTTPTANQKKRPSSNRSNKAAPKVGTARKDTNDIKSSADFAAQKPKAQQKKSAENAQKLKSEASRPKKPTAKKVSPKTVDGNKASSEKKTEIPAKTKKRTQKPNKKVETPAD